MKIQIICRKCKQVSAELGIEGSPDVIARWVVTRIEEFKKGEADRFTHCEKTSILGVSETGVLAQVDLE